MYVLSSLCLVILPTHLSPGLVLNSITISLTPSTLSIIHLYTTIRLVVTETPYPSMVPWTPVLLLFLVHRTSLTFFLVSSLVQSLKFNSVTLLILTILHFLIPRLIYWSFGDSRLSQCEVSLTFRNLCSHTPTPNFWSGEWFVLPLLLVYLRLIVEFMQKNLRRYPWLVVTNDANSTFPLK